MNKIFCTALVIISVLTCVSGRAQTHTNQNGIRMSVTNSFSASGAQARQFEIARIGYNSHHWQSGGILIVELFETRYSTGYEKYFVQLGYKEGTDTTTPKIYHVESKGGNHHARVRLGEPSDLGTSHGGYKNYSIPLLVDVRHYSHYRAKLTYLRHKVDELTSYGQIQIFESPSPVDIADFTGPSALSYNLQLDGYLRVSGEEPHYITGAPVGIGTSKTDANTALTVGGAIKATEVIVTTDAGADFVFDEHYKVMGLSEIQAFVAKHNHLPDIPSAAEMVEKGVNVGDLQIKLLQKIEELTLLMIEQDAKMETLIKENDRQRREIDSLKRINAN